MSLKRKLSDIETGADDTSLQPVKKVKTSSHESSTLAAEATKKRKSLSGSVYDDLNSNLHKKPKLNADSLSTVTPKAIAKRDKKTWSKRSTAKSNLVPRGDRQKATLGEQDDSLLRMLCDDSKTGGAKELHFRKIPHSMIDWNDPQHIGDINSWRNQIYGRAGVKAKQVVMWHEEEELWFELYFHLSIAESRTRGILLPKTKAILDAFNDTFVGKVLMSKDGYEMEARGERQLNAFASKFNRMFPHLRARLHQSIFGKSGDTFVPKITTAMLKKYQQMKADMVAQGITGESVYSNNLNEWQHFLSHLPSSAEEKLHIPHEAIEDTVNSQEDDAAAAALVSMSRQSFNSQGAWSTDSEDDQLEASSIDITNLVPVTPTTHGNLRPLCSSLEDLQDSSLASNRTYDSDFPATTYPKPLDNVLGNENTPKSPRPSPTSSLQSSDGPLTPTQCTQSFDDHLMGGNDRDTKSYGYNNALLASNGNKIFTRTTPISKLGATTETENLSRDVPGHNPLPGAQLP